jgi:exopolyphosphatase/guanosine-5'-triphosphate,3'-diphosphate pyrophosphatase
VLPGGLAILYTLATHFGIQSLLPARGALRQGVIIDLRERLEALRHVHPEDVRDETVRELQQRFGVATDQALRVRALAQSLYDAVGGGDTHGESRRELGWACDLHEIGQMVSHHDHHRHSAYLMANVDAAGFSQSQQRRISELVLGQRGGLRKLDQALAHEGFAWQTLCLRLAVIKCHARGAIDAKAWRLRRDNGTARLEFSPQWGESSPRTLHLLREEAEAWARQGPLRLLLPQ